MPGDGDLRVEGSSPATSLKGSSWSIDGAEVVADVQAQLGRSSKGHRRRHLGDEAVAIRSSARVSGAIRGSSISIEEGATVSGRIEADFELPPELGGKARSLH